VSFFKASISAILFAGLTVTPALASRVHRPPTSGHSQGTRKVSRKTTHKLRGQQAIQPERAAEIQHALIREHYLTGEPTGKWDANTEAAMQKYQADQGWQTKLMPDSRALKRLGLGPDYSTAINARTASFSDPQPVSTIPTDQAAGFAAAAGIKR